MFQRYLLIKTLNLLWRAVWLSNWAMCQANIQCKLSMEEEMFVPQTCYWPAVQWDLFNDDFLIVFQICRSPGFGISLVAETTTGAMLSVQTASTPAGEGQSVVPEDLGKQAAEMLLEEIYRVSLSLQWNLAVQICCNFARIVTGIYKILLLINIVTAFFVVMQKRCGVLIQSLQKELNSTPC